MAKQKTKIAFENHLNDLYTDSLSEGQAIDQFIYLTNKSRNGEKTTENGIRRAHTNHTLGSMLRRCDPIAFEVAFNDWNP
jgi:hypothetical protein